MNRPATKHPIVPFAAVIAATIGALWVSVGSTWAQAAPGTLPTSPHLSGLGATDLERAFWVCDYLSTTQRVSDVGTCSAVSEALKGRKFAGDLDGLLAWWRQHKVAEHRKIAATLGVKLLSDGSAHE